ncbi:hypothetical protein [Methylobacterium sp.]|uniref:hypothetical protein n=1 Tax=Methylobacterium sp. TaxID=409 RepID=UPI0034551091
MAALIDMNDKVRPTPALATDSKAQALAGRFRRALKRHGALPDASCNAGKVRRCHGDLTLRNICHVDGVPTPSDCIEFDEALACIDVLQDLAFVLMDLWHLGRPDLANLLFNRYLDETDETGGLGLLPFLMAVRATIRAHVTAVQAEGAVVTPAGRRVQGNGIGPDLVIAQASGTEWRGDGAGLPGRPDEIAGSLQAGIVEDTRVEPLCDAQLMTSLRRPGTGSPIGEWRPASPPAGH